MQKDPDTDIYVAHQSKRMMSLAMYRKLKSVVDSWDREERGKAKVVAGAAYGFVVCVALVSVGALLSPTHTGWFVPVGFLVWLVFVLTLIRRHLAAARERS